MGGEQSNHPLAEGRWFATTHWSVVLAAGDSASPKASAALEKLCRAYWYPLYAFIRRRGHAEHDAQDLTQGFLTRLLQRRAFRAVAPDRGRFRSFLLSSLNNFLKDHHDWEQAQKRGGGKITISFDAQEAEQRYLLEPVHLESPEKLFERRWALQLLDTALARLEQEFTASGKRNLFEQLRGSIVDGGLDGTLGDVAVRMGMSEEAVKKSVQRLRQRYQEVIREEIGRTVATVGEVDEELRYLWSVLGA